MILSKTAAKYYICHAKETGFSNWLPVNKSIEIQNRQLDLTYIIWCEPLMNYYSCLIRQRAASMTLKGGSFKLCLVIDCYH